jgi:glycolate dehydrogenase FAD-binding subunit
MSRVVDLSTRLEKLIGSDRVHSSDPVLHEYAIAGRAPLAVLKPRSPDEVAEAVAFAVAEKLSVVACGSRSKLEIGMPPQRYSLALDITELRQIAHYDPGDLTVSVGAGMPLHELSKVLASKDQFLPLQVPCRATSTVAGSIASGIDSALRQQYGTARDFLIGAEFVDGTGKQCKSGGRVVKNVTGYDLHKLLMGSLGTLGIITRLNFRTFPLPELQGAYLAGFPTLEAALNFHASLLKSGLPLSNLELFDSGFSQLLAQSLRKAENDLPELLAQGGWQAFATFEGSTGVIKRIQRELRERFTRELAARGGPLDSKDIPVLSEALRESFAWLRSAAPVVALVRIVLPQTASRDLTELLHISQPSPLRSAFVLRACNVAYLALLGIEAEQSNESLVHEVTGLLNRVEAKKGAATILHAPHWMKDRTQVWGAKRPDFLMLQRVKQAFDPHNIFAPGRFVGGI